MSRRQDQRQAAAFYEGRAAMIPQGGLLACALLASHPAQPRQRQRQQRRACSVSAGFLAIPRVTTATSAPAAASTARPCTGGGGVACKRRFAGVAAHAAPHAALHRPPQVQRSSRQRPAPASPPCPRAPCLTCTPPRPWRAARSLVGLDVYSCLGSTCERKGGWVAGTVRHGRSLRQAAETGRSACELPAAHPPPPCNAHRKDVAALRVVNNVPRGIQPALAAASRAAQQLVKRAGGRKGGGSGLAATAAAAGASPSPLRRLLRGAHNQPAAPLRAAAAGDTAGGSEQLRHRVACRQGLAGACKWRIVSADTRSAPCKAGERACGSLLRDALEMAFRDGPSSPLVAPAWSQQAHNVVAHCAQEGAAPAASRRRRRERTAQPAASQARAPPSPPLAS